MNFNKKKILVITDGSEGMISQVQGLANHLSTKISKIETQLIFPWSKLQPGILPIFDWIFKNDVNKIKKPDIIISCGRKSVYLSLYLKKKFNKKVINVHIQNPKINFYNFNFIISPNHDGIKGSNVINSIGAIHHFKKINLQKYKRPKYFQSTKKFISIIVGGSNRHYNFSKEVVLNLTKEIINLKKNYPKYDFLVISSRRTGKENINLFKKKLHNIAYVWDGKNSNPYGYALLKSKFFIVTSDSTSMISECSLTGKPIYVFYLPEKRKSKRLNYFHKEFEKLKITRKFSSKVNFNEWKYKTLDEAKRISGILKKRIIEEYSNESK